MMKVSFIPNTSIAATELYVRRVGRPRKEWIKEVMCAAINLFGSHSNVIDLAKEEYCWKSAINRTLSAKTRMTSSYTPYLM